MQKFLPCFSPLRDTTTFSAARNQFDQLNEKWGSHTMQSPSFDEGLLLLGFQVCRINVDEFFRLRFHDFLNSL